MILREFFLVLKTKPSFVTSQAIPPVASLGEVVMKVIGVTVSLILLLSSLPLAHGSPRAKFSLPVDYASNGINSNWLVAKDINGDGKVDLVIGNDTSVSVMLGKGDGTFEEPAVYAGGVSSQSLFVVDMNGDGALDIVAGDGNNVRVFLGNGNGTFQAAITTSVTFDALGVGDVNGDGKQDVVLTTGAGLVTLFGNGDGSFKTPVKGNSFGSGILAVGDLNGDHKADVALVTFGGLISQKERNKATIGVMFGNGDGTFQAPVNYQDEGFFPNQLTIDTSGDVFVVNQLSGANPVRGGIDELVNDGLGNFYNSFGVSAAGEYAYAAAIGDLNGDGYTDVVFVIQGEISIDLALGLDTQHGVGYPPKDVAIADLNGDGQNDIITVSPCLSFTDCSSGKASVFINEKVDSHTIVSSSSNPSTVGQAVTFTATISSIRGAVPNGVTVSFYDKSKLLGTGITSGGAAEFSTSLLAAGAHTIKAEFPGCIFVKPSLGTIQLTVNP